MRRAIPAAMVWAVWLAASGAGGAAGVQPVGNRIADLLDGATAAPSVAAADKKLDEAERLLRSARLSLGEVTAGLLNADIKRARGRVRLIAWQRAAEKTDLRDQARRLLLEALAEYQQLAKQADDQAIEIEEKQANYEKKPGWRKALDAISRANYAMAWTAYNAGMVMTTREQCQEYFNQAIQKFAPFTAGGYRENEQHDPIIADCFLGQALCNYELQRYAKVIELLDNKPAKPEYIPPTTTKRMTFLRLKTYRNQRRNRELHEAAEQYFARLPEEHQYDPIELAMAIEWGRSLAALAADRESNPYHQQYQKRLELLERMIYPYGEPWRSELGRVVGRTGASTTSGNLARAREHFAAGKYQEALSEVGKALAAAEEVKETNASLLADLRYTKAAAAWNLKRWRDAHLAAFDFVRRHRKDRRAPEMCAYALQAGLKAVKDSPRLDTASFLSFLDFAEQEFPDQPDVAKAPWYRANRWLEAGQYERAEQALCKVTADSPVYRHAQYGLALAACKQAESIAGTQKRDAAAVVAALERAAAAVARYVDAASGGLPADEEQVAEAVIDVAVAAARRLLDLPAPGPTTGLALLERVETLPHAAGRAPDQRLALRIKAYLLAGRTEGAAKLLDVLLEGKSAGAAVAGTCADIAEALEKQYQGLLKDGNSAGARPLGERLISVYGFLLRYLSGSKDAHARSQEISVRRRLAHSLQRLGRQRTAISHYEWLFNKVPEEIPLEKAGDILHGLATAYEHTGQYDAAAKTWRTLAGGLEQKSEGWLEARYHLILCRYRAGRPDHARKLLDYFKLQCPSIEIEQWSRKFHALEQQLASEED